MIEMGLESIFVIPLILWNKALINNTNAIANWWLNVNAFFLTLLIFNTVKESEFARTSREFTNLLLLSS